DPHDVDVALRIERDERLVQEIVSAIMSGGNPFAPVRRALAGTSRGLQFQYEDQAREQLVAEGTVMVPLWRRGDTLEDARAVLHGIAEDPAAGRAERHDMIEAFTGLDRYIPRQVRAELIEWQNEGLISISQVQLPDAPDDSELLATPEMRWAVNRRWQTDSPLRRAALAGLTYLAQGGADLDLVDLAGQRLPTPGRRAGRQVDAEWRVNWKWSGYRAIPRVVPDGGAWLEIIHPTRTRPLTGLLIESAGTPGPGPLRSERNLAHPPL
ncbi:hypothetical protein, partial [Streptacidiphilus anmyonensis]|uniref:hypothetical protein n=1 Tax=Streptacidiphilus anmyonensis TaxID=405782 RepID=UPI0005A60A44